MNRAKVESLGFAGMFLCIGSGEERRTTKRMGQFTNRFKKCHLAKKQNPAQGRGLFLYQHAFTSYVCRYAFLFIQFRSSNATSRRLIKVSSPLRSHTRGS